MQEAATILGPAEAVRRERTELVRPTLLIGLGGTGREVLLRLRQRFFERFGVARLPTTAFLWIDTDIDNPETVEGKSADFLSRGARLDTTEIVDATVAPEQFMAYFRDSHQNPHIFDWIYAGLQKNGSIQHGARKVRPLGRLAFFHRAGEIRRRLIRAAQDVSDDSASERMRTQFGIEVPTGSLNVLIVCSLAGGTGSGMFLDASFMVRHLSATGAIPSANTVGYLVLPSVFAPSLSEDTERVYANAYAALKELEYYSMRKDLREEPTGPARSVADSVSRLSAHDFVVNWEARETLNVVGPPFGSTFLIGNRPADGTPIHPKHAGDIFDMIAENIYVDYTQRDFAARKRSLRSNLEDFLKNDLEYAYRENDDIIYRELFSYRFSTFGLSKLYVPVDRVRRACSARLGVDLLDRWLAVVPPEGDLLAYVQQQEAEALGVRAGRGRDDIRQRLDRVDEKEESFAAAIRSFWGGERREALRERTRQPEPELRAAHQREFDQYGKAYFNDPPEQENWGQFLRRLRLVTSPKTREELEARLLERLHGWLNSRVRLTLATEYLKAYSLYLGKLREDYARRAETLRAEARRHRARWDRILSVIEEEERGLWVHRHSMRVLSDEACSTAARYFEVRLHSELFTVAARLCEEMQGVVGSERVETDPRGTDVVVRSGLVQQLFTLSGDLWEVRRELQARLDAFDRAEDHHVFVNLYRPKMFEQFYRLRRTDGTFAEVSEAALRDLEPQLRQELNVRSPYDLFPRLRERGVSPVRDQVEAFCARLFHDLDEQSADAVRLLYTLGKRGELRADEEIARLAERGNVWLAPSERAMEGGTKLGANYAAAALLGVNRAQSGYPDYVDLRGKVNTHVGRLRALKGEHTVEVDTAADGVFFYTELAGIPLAYVERIDGYREAYRGLLEKEYLHIDRHADRFTDIVLKTQQEVRLTVRITRAVLLGVLLGVLEVAGDGEDAVVVYVDTSHYPPVRRRVGGREQAREVLARDRRLLGLVEDAVDRRIQQLSDVEQQRFYALLVYHVADGAALGLDISGPFAQREVRIGDQITTRVPVEHAAIVEAMRDLERRIGDRRREPAPALQRLWDSIFRQWWPRRSEFAQEIRLGKDRLFTLRPGAAQPDILPTRSTWPEQQPVEPPGPRTAPPPGPQPETPDADPVRPPTASPPPSAGLAPQSDETGLAGVFD